MAMAGRHYGEWTVLQDVDLYRCLCKCSCGTEKIIYNSTLTRGRSKSCGHTQLKSIIGNQYGYLTVIKKIDREQYLCKCICGKEVIKLRTNLRSGQSISCGCKKKENKSIKDISIGDNFYEWTVIDNQISNNKIKCKCSCGNIKYINAYTLVSGMSKSCGHANTSMKITYNKGDIIGNWIIGNQTRTNDGRVAYTCTCKCGNKSIVSDRQLRNGSSLSCGCMSSSFIDLTGETFGELYVLSYVGNLYWECKCSCGNTITTLGTRLRNGDIVRCDKCKSLFQSSKEKDIYNYIKEIYNGLVIEKDRTLINPYEIDIYIPEKELAIEFNGSYWHSEASGKDKYYHRLKTEQCAKLGIQLIHIFEHEWDTNEYKIKNLLNSFLLENNNLEIIDDEHISKLINNDIITLELHKDTGEINIIEHYFNENAIKKLIKSIKFSNTIKVMDDLSKCNINAWLNNGFKVKTISEPDFIYYDTNKKEIVSNITNSKTYKIYDCGKILFELTL